MLRSVACLQCAVDAGVVARVNATFVANAAGIGVHVLNVLDIIGVIEVEREPSPPFRVSPESTAILAHTSVHFLLPLQTVTLMKYLQVRVRR